MLGSYVVYIQTFTKVYIPLDTFSQTVKLCSDQLYQSNEPNLKARRRVQVRVMISDFAVFSAICIMVFVDVIVGLDTDKLQVPDKFEASCSLCC